MGALISVIVPVYNVESYLEACIDSIAAQTYRDLEIILVDDGSTDRSGAICDAYAERDQRIRVLHKANGGLSDARNAGIECAAGEYFSFIDSDDMVTPDALETMYGRLRETGSQIAVCNMVRIYEDGRSESFYAPSDTVRVCEGEQRFITLNQPSVCNKLFCAELFRGIRFPVGKYYEDTYVYHELLYRAEKVVLTGTAGYRYLSREGSILGQPRYTVRYFDCIEAVSLRLRFLEEHGICAYAREAALSLYAAMANARKHIPRTRETEAAYQAAEEAYLYAYRLLMREKTTSVKQKVRLVLLRYAPALHAKLY